MIAQYYLAWQYLRRRRVPDADRWFVSAAMQGHPQALFVTSMELTTHGDESTISESDNDDNPVQALEMALFQSTKDCTFKSTNTGTLIMLARRGHIRSIEALCRAQMHPTSREMQSRPANMFHTDALSSSDVSSWSRTARTPLSLHTDTSSSSDVSPWSRSASTLSTFDTDTSCSLDLSPQSCLCLETSFDLNPNSVHALTFQQRAIWLCKIHRWPQGYGWVNTASGLLGSLLGACLRHDCDQRSWLQAVYIIGREFAKDPHTAARYFDGDPHSNPNDSRAGSWLISLYQKITERARSTALQLMLCYRRPESGLRWYGGGAGIVSMIAKLIYASRRDPFDWLAEKESQSYFTFPSASAAAPKRHRK